MPNPTNYPEQDGVDEMKAVPVYMKPDGDLTLVPGYTITVDQTQLLNGETGTAAHLYKLAGYLTPGLSFNQTITGSDDKYITPKKGKP